MKETYQCKLAIKLKNTGLDKVQMTNIQDFTKCAGFFLNGKEKAFKAFKGTIFLMKIL